MSTALAPRFVSLRVARKRKAKPESGWHAVRRAAERREKRMARGVKNAAKAAKKALDYQVFESTLANRSTDLRAIDVAADTTAAILSRVMKPEFVRVLRDTLKSAGSAELDFRQRPHRGFRISSEARFAQTVAMVRFDVTNERVIQWIEQHAGENIDGISKESKAAIKAILTDSFERGVPTGRIVKHVRGVIGLTETQAQAVMSLADEIADNPGGRVQAGDRTIRVPDDPSDEWIDDRLEGYADKLLTDRAKSIARTETIAAANEGQREAWLQAEEAGLLDRDEVERVWIVTPDDRLCPICEELEGATAELDGTFTSDEVGELAGPPAHPNCRCAQGLQAVSAQRAARQHVIPRMTGGPGSGPQKGGGSSKDIGRSMRPVEKDSLREVLSSSTFDSVLSASKFDEVVESARDRYGKTIKGKDSAVLADREREQVANIKQSLKNVHDFSDRAKAASNPNQRGQFRERAKGAATLTAVHVGNLLAIGDVKSGRSLTAGPHDWATAMITLPGGLSDKIRALGKEIPDEWIAEQGRETNPHVTVLHGLHDAMGIDIVRGFGPVGFTLGEVDAFEGVQEGTADALLIHVEGNDLSRLRKVLMELPHKEPQSDYQPHVTIAYVQVGRGKDLASKMSGALSGEKVTSTALMFSGKLNERRVIPLAGQSVEVM